MSQEFLSACMNLQLYTRVQCGQKRTKRFRTRTVPVIYTQLTELVAERI